MRLVANEDVELMVIGGAYLFTTLTPHCRISTMFFFPPSTHRSPHRCLHNTQGHRKERRLANKKARPDPT